MRTIVSAIQYAAKYGMEITHNATLDTFQDRYGNTIQATCCRSTMLPIWTGAKQLYPSSCDICGKTHKINGQTN